MLDHSYSLTPLQQGMLFHQLSARDRSLDVHQFVVTMRERVAVAAFEQAWQTVIEHHAALRTYFRWENIPQPRQIVAPTIALPLIQLDWRNKTPEQQNSDLTAYRLRDRERGFDLDTPPLMRVTLIRTGETTYKCVWTFHHILIDGRSMTLVLRDLFAVYAALKVGNSVNLREPNDYHTYVEWLDAQNFETSEPYWRSLLADFTAPSPVDLGKVSAPRELVPLQEETLVSLHPEPVEGAEITQSLQQFAQHHNVTTNTLLQTAWSLLLCHYTNSEDVVFGSTRACRYAPVAGLKEMIGMVINTVPMRVQLTEETTLAELLQTVRSQHVAHRQHEHTPLANIQKWSDVTQGANLFDSLVVYENQPYIDTLREWDAGWRNREVEDFNRNNFPLTLIAFGGEQLLLRIAYHADKFEREMVRGMLGHLRVLLREMIDSAEKPALSIAYIDSAEREQLLAQETDWKVRSTGTIVGRFEQMVARTPNASALTFGNEQLTYTQLNRRANQVAHKLQALGVKPNSLVGLYVERSFDIVIGILAILKAGGAYVPLDPAYPAERLALIIDDADLPIVLTQDALRSTLPDTLTHTVVIDALESDLSTENLGVELSAENLAYVIYTSGSTGKPKGALITHANVTRLFDNTDHWFNFGAKDVWTLFHSFAFDFSVWEIWGALFYGGRLVIVPYLTSRSPEQFWQLLIDEGVTILNQTPSAFRQLIPYAVNRNPLSEDRLRITDYGLRTVIFGGEALDLAMPKPWVDRFGDEQPRLVNMYGITETTVHVTYRPISTTDITTNQGSLIGEPIPDLQLYILDKRMEPVPAGIIGEMYVGGAGVANGYLNRPNLTAQRFIRIPYTEHRIPYTVYRTGDLARRLPNGDIEFIGRADQQVKIRGFRIELGEIEAALRQHETVRDCVVVVGNEKRLIAYVIPQQSITESVLREWLAQFLPSYMVPGAIVLLEHFPLTNNGKLNRRALPAPSKRSPTFGKSWASTPPRTTTERQIASIWRTVLQLEQVGAKDNFFEIGGDSLLVVQVMGRIREHFGRKIAVHHLYQYPTIREIANFIDHTATEKQTNGHDTRAQHRRNALRRRRDNRVKNSLM